MSLDLVSIRTAIAQTLAGVTVILRVDDYTYRGESIGNLPVAQILRGPVQMRSLSLTGEEADTQLGSYDYLVPWTIRVTAAFADLVDAQEYDDQLAEQLQEAFNGNRLLDPIGAGVVDNSRLTVVSSHLDEDHTPALWITDATLETFIVASL